MSLAQTEAFHQRKLRLIALTDDGNHLVDVEQHQLATFQNMDTVQHFVQAVLRTSEHRGGAELNPLGQHVAQRLWHRTTIDAHHGEVDGRRGFQAGVRQQGGDEFLLLNRAGLGLEHQTHGRIFAGLIAHHVQHSEHRGFELGLVGAECFFTGLDLGVGELFNLFQHALAAHARRQFVHHQLPLATGQLFNRPAGAHFERAAAGAVRIRDVRRTADDLAAPRVIGRRQDLQQLGVAHLGGLDECHAGIGHFAQVVAGYFGGHAHGNAAGPVEQGKGQARG